MKIFTTDVLILGAGLAGLRAAWAARETAPARSVTVVTLRQSPAGSSFSNRNDALGLQVLTNSEHQKTFASEVIDLAGPGWVDEYLVTIMATENAERFADLENLGLTFRMDGNDYRRYTGCGSPYERAVIIEGLMDAHQLFRQKNTALGVEVTTGIEVLGLISDGTARGAWGIDQEGTPVIISAGSTIMALGGPAPLFPHSVAGTGNPGYGWGLLDETGARMENTPFLQFMWYDRDGQFVPIGHTLQGAYILTEDKRALIPESEIGNNFKELCDQRGTHCPFFYDRPDSTLDELLFQHAWQDGFSRIARDGEVIEAAMHAHAGNGGAVIDKHGQTSIPGLYAAGECATGMHGANRMGGAMVLATQVFGKRAGEAAARSRGQAMALEEIVGLIPEEVNIDERRKVLEARTLALI